MDEGLIYARPEAVNQSGGAAAFEFGHTQQVAVKRLGLIVFAGGIEAYVVKSGDFYNGSSKKSRAYSARRVVRIFLVYGHQQLDHPAGYQNVLDDIKSKPDQHPVFAARDQVGEALADARVE